MLLNPRKESESLDLLLPGRIEQNAFFCSKLVLVLFAMEISKDSISEVASDVMLFLLAQGLTINPYALYGLISAFLPC